MNISNPEIQIPAAGRRHNRYSEEFKRQVIAASLEPGVSKAAIAQANGLNANMLRRWVHESSPVEFFHQFIFFRLGQFNDVACRKLIWSICNRLIDVARLNPVDLSDIGIKQDAFIPDLNDQVCQALYFYHCVHVVLQCYFYSSWLRLYGGR